MIHIASPAAVGTPRRPRCLTGNRAACAQRLGPTFGPLGSSRLWRRTQPRQGGGGQTWTWTRPRSIQSAGFWQDPQARPALGKGCRQCPRRGLCYRNFGRHHYTTRDLNTTTPHTLLQPAELCSRPVLFVSFATNCATFHRLCCHQPRMLFWASPSSEEARLHVRQLRSPP
jgi:hypothetical protein